MVSISKSPILLVLSYPIIAFLIILTGNVLTPSHRAGCNFSGISGNDKNALKWDRHGYAHLTKMASERGKEAYVQRCNSIEYWDENVSRDKIKAMSDYLGDVSIKCGPITQLPFSPYVSFL